MVAPKNRGYKRSWRNYLLNARYQLLFTLTMVAICGLLIAVIGWRVMLSADKATGVSENNILSIECQKPDLSALAPSRAVEIVTDDATIEEEEAAAEAALEDAGDATEDEGEATEGEGEGEAAAPTGEATGAGATAEGSDAAARADEREAGQAPAVVVDIIEEPPVGAIARYHLCRAQRASTLERLRVNRDRILRVLIGAGVLLCIGLAFYGIKMTHKVAGPLHKVGLYFAKMRDGKYDTVYSLRKGDQLVEFYAHFKQAHEGMRKVETADVEMLRELIAIADAAKLGDLSAEARAALEELREVLKRKEDAIG